MAARKMNHANLFTVEMDRHALIEGDDWQRFFWSRIDFPRALTTFLQAFSHIRLRDYRGLSTKCGISARVIAVPVGIENEFELSLAQSL
jgi:hypothetical protein